MQLLSALGQSRTQGNHIEYKRPLLQLLSLSANWPHPGREGEKAPSNRFVKRSLK